MDDEILGNVPQPLDGREASSELLSSTNITKSEDTLNQLIQKELQIQEEKPLVEKALRDDSEAWGTIYETCQPQVQEAIYSFMLKSLPVQGQLPIWLAELVPLLADRIMKKAFWEIGNYVPGKPLIAWILEIAELECTARCEAWKKTLQIMEEEKPLIEKARQGDNAAWKIICENYGPIIGQFIWSYLCRKAPLQDRKPQRIEDLVEDLTQDTLVESLESIASYQPRRPLIAWFFGIAKHVCYARCKDLRKECGNVYLGAYKYEQDDADPDIEEIVPPKRAIFHQAWSKLSPEQRRVIQLRFDEELSFKEIAEITGYPAKNAKMFVSRFRDRLETLKAEYENGPPPLKRRRRSKKPRPPGESGEET